MAKVTLPKGYQPISAGGDFAPSWDFRREKSVQGTILSYRKVKVKSKKKGEKDRDVRIATLRVRGRGDFSIWESVGLRSLFTLPKKSDVYIQLTGARKVPGRPQKMRTFIVATTDEHAPRSDGAARVAQGRKKK